MFDAAIVAEVRRTREELARQCGFDVAVMFANLRERQKGLGGRLVRRRREGRAEPAPARDAEKAPRP
jgi:hypothetical protein